MYSLFLAFLQVLKNFADISVSSRLFSLKLSQRLDYNLINILRPKGIVNKSYIPAFFFKFFKFVLIAPQHALLCLLFQVGTAECKNQEI